MANAIVKKIDVIGSEVKWRALPMESFEKHIVNPMLELSEEELMGVVQSLSERNFDMLRKKLWTVQDLPEEEDGHNRTLGIMTVLKRLLLFRIPMAPDQPSKSSLTQQLAHASLILNPILISGALPRVLEDDGREVEDELELCNLDGGEDDEDEAEEADPE